MATLGYEPVYPWHSMIGNRGVAWVTRDDILIAYIVECADAKYHWRYLVYSPTTRIAARGDTFGEFACAVQECEQVMTDMGWAP